MTPPEKYYALLDQAWPMNVLIFAELDRCFAPEFVEERWRTYAGLRVLARTVATPDLTLADPGLGDTHFSTAELPAEEWDRELDREAGVVYGLDWPLRCRYLASPDEGRSRVLMIGHHSVIDGRIGIAELQAFLRVLDGQEIPVQQALSLPGTSARRHVWQDDRAAKLDLLRSLAARNQELGEPGPEWWPPADGPRELHFASAPLSAERTGTILARGRAHGSSLFSTMAAAWLSGVATDLCGTDVATLQLNAPVDLSAASHDASRPPAMAVAVLAQRYRTDPDPWTLAVDIARSTGAALARGEADLFFELARMDRVRDLAGGVSTVADGLAAAPPAVTVSNMGVIDPGSDPAWVRWIAGTLAPTPNQVVFSALLGYRGQLVEVVSTDHARLPADRDRRLSESTAARVDAMLRT
jgi:hypothetical protein